MSVAWHLAQTFDGRTAAYFHAEPRTDPDGYPLRDADGRRLYEWIWEGPDDIPALVDMYDLDQCMIECGVGVRVLLGDYAVRRLPYTDPRPLLMFVRDDGLWRLWWVRLKWQEWWMQTRRRVIQTAVLWNLARLKNGPYTMLGPGLFGGGALVWWFQEGFR